jgi:hypothetical protein
MKLAGEFEFLGYAYRGDPEFDAPPPKGVVKLFYLGRDAPEDMPEDDRHGETSERCGFFKCAWWRWAGFKEAAARHHADRAARGRYPVASIVVVPSRAPAEPAHKEALGGR